jgi:glycosyltransferase involved in cell wall biosynthesis
MQNEESAKGAATAAEHVLIFNHDLKMYPPILSIINVLTGAGRTVSYLGHCSDNNIVSQLHSKGVRYFEAINNKVDDNPLTKLLKLFMYRRKVLSLLKRTASPDTFVWIFGNQNIFVLHDIIPRYRCISYLFEVPELSVSRRYRLLSPTINYANAMRGAFKVVCCEYNRAHITKAYFGLKDLPAVIPNKPAFTMKEVGDLPTDLAGGLPSDHSTKIILYQGILNYPERRVEELCQAVAYLPEDYVVVVMAPENEYKRRLKHKYEGRQVRFLPFVPPPLHLQVTRRAFIGVLSYFPGSGLIGSSLNTLYCAPNKVYEYSMFGVPMLSNDVPAMDYLFRTYGAGVCVREFSPEGIATAIRTISESHIHFSSGAAKLYASVDLGRLVCDLIEPGQAAPAHSHPRPLPAQNDEAVSPACRAVASAAAKYMTSDSDEQRGDLPA